MKSYKILDLIQGSIEWEEARLNYLCASEAPAVMGESKFMSRNQLLDLKKGWISNPNSSFKEMLFEKGHEHEEMARPIFEFEMAELFHPLVASFEVAIDGEHILFLASFDGLGEENGEVWEHKDWNLTLAENIRNGVLEALYYWQLEHQMLVAGVKEATITCSDGTRSNKVSMIYKSVPKRRKALIAASKQFLIDLKNHVIEAKQEIIIAKKAESFPLITFEVNGTEISSNISTVLNQIQQRSEIEINRILETDQDFADKHKFNKATKQAREDLKVLVTKVQNKFVSYSEFASVAKEIDYVLQQMQSQGEKQVKKAQTDKKKKIEDAAYLVVSNYTLSVDSVINPIRISSLINCNIDFTQAMKNKRTIESLQNAVDSTIATWKIEVDEIRDLVVKNLETLRKLAEGFEPLFMDSTQLVTKDNDALVAIIKVRISEHKESEQKKLDDEREKIRIEEEEKAENKIKGKNLIMNWKSLLDDASKNDNVDFVRSFFDQISNSDCDPTLFLDNYNEALKIYDDCFTGISDRLIELKKQKELAKAVGHLSSLRKEPTEQDKAFDNMVATGQGFVDCTGKSVDPEELYKTPEPKTNSITTIDGAELKRTSENEFVCTKSGSQMPVSERLGERFKNTKKELLTYKVHTVSGNILIYVDEIYLDEFPCEDNYENVYSDTFKFFLKLFKAGFYMGAQSK